MARLVPAVSISSIKVKSERDVANALKTKLPDNCVVYHSYPWLRLDRSEKNQTLNEGEIDFLIIWPEKGVLVLEVKGGGITQDAQTKAWYSTDRHNRMHKIKDPFEQARNGFHEITRRMRKNSIQLNFTRGYAVCFPDTTYKNGTTSDSDPAIIFDANDLRYIDRSIAKALKKWSRTTETTGLERQVIADIERAISPTLHLMPLLSRTLEHQEEQLVRMTDSQTMILNFLESHNQAAIEGVAGAGKTLLAIEQARRFAEQGKEVLLLCFNRGLAQWLRHEVKALGYNNIEAFHFHELVHDWCQKSGIPFHPENKMTREFWLYETPNLLWHAADILQKRFDAIIVDEGQDFIPEWWVALEALKRDEQESALFIFYDGAQTVFRNENHLPKDIPKAGTLSANCRNTQAIARFCANILKHPIQCSPHAPEGETPEQLVIKDDGTRKNQINQWLSHWLKQGIQPSQIALLSPRSQGNTCLKGAAHISNLPLSNDVNLWRADKSILTTTIRAFKGLEADIIILYDLFSPEPESVFTLTDFYVGASRAKHILKVLSASPVIIDEKISPEMELETV